MTTTRVRPEAMKYSMLDMEAARLRAEVSDAAVAKIRWAGVPLSEYPRDVLERMIASQAHTLMRYRQKTRRFVKRGR